MIWHVPPAGRSYGVSVSVPSTMNRFESKLKEFMIIHSTQFITIGGMIIRYDLMLEIKIKITSAAPCLLGAHGCRDRMQVLVEDLFSSEAAV